MTLDYAPRSDTASSLLSVMRRLGVHMAFAKGEEIFAQEEDADLIYAITTGVARTSRLLSDGRRQIGDFYYKGDVVGLELGAVHHYTAEALTDCTVLVVKRSSLHAFSGDGELDRAIWEATQRELARTQEHLLVLSRKSACERVASFLLDVAQREDGEDVDLPMGRQDMADYLGLTIETVSRMVTQLQAAKIVEFPSSRRFRISRWTALERLAE